MASVRNSRGRTGREFMPGMRLKPSAIGSFRLGTFSGYAIRQEMAMGTGPAPEAAGSSRRSATGICHALNGTIGNIGTPLWTGDMCWTARPLSALAIPLLVRRFVPPAGRGALAMAMAMASKKPPARLRNTWGNGIGATAAMLLLAGRLGALRTAFFPISFSIIAIFARLFRFPVNEKRRAGRIFRDLRGSVQSAADPAWRATRMRRARPPNGPKAAGRLPEP
ncbi:BCCT family transporter [Mangrovicoccus sp. HB161399]|uniref:BCCT family transporter n=1 Tax=Mangrovicoccus sp. HB161399 TaxID=2720392 RepID=UPI001556E58A|nr:BCCT family transporter [Mangrovicoccus sp. HB161399]